MPSLTPSAYLKDEDMEDLTTQLTDKFNGLIAENCRPLSDDARKDLVTIALDLLKDNDNDYRELSAPANLRSHESQQKLSDYLLAAYTVILAREEMMVLLKEMDSIVNEMNKTIDTKPTNEKQQEEKNEKLDQLQNKLDKVKTRMVTVVDFLNKFDKDKNRQEKLKQPDKVNKLVDEMPKELFKLKDSPELKKGTELKDKDILKKDEEKFSDKKDKKDKKETDRMKLKFKDQKSKKEAQQKVLEEMRPLFGGVLPGETGQTRGIVQSIPNGNEMGFVFGAALSADSAAFDLSGQYYNSAVGGTRFDQLLSTLEGSLASDIALMDKAAHDARSVDNVDDTPMEVEQRLHEAHSTSLGDTVLEVGMLKDHKDDMNVAQKIKDSAITAVVEVLEDPANNFTKSMSLRPH